ncbi:MAG: hypothetical protein A2X59_03905 [Nitrospirae bacterium GWC2_42_7]|nr:MAG: hypothetical protein A2X59_03905 [Nitrospirae bacterium GWC2_42_7]
MRKAIVLISALLILAGINASIYGKEQLLSKGKVVLLELAPVDPRSLMQGDYMALRFKAANDAFGAGIYKRELPRDGKIVLLLDERNVATFKRFHDDSPLPANEVVIRYRIRGNQPKFATNAFFFQEGHAEYYTKARFGEFRVADNGECILTNMRDENLTLLGPQTAR